MTGSSNAGRWASAVALPQQKPEEHRAATQNQPDHRRQAQPRWCVGLGDGEAPRTDAQDSVHDQAEPEGGQPCANQIEAGPLFGRRIGRAPVQEEHDAENEDLADEHVSP